MIIFEIQMTPLISFSKAHERVSVFEENSSEAELLIQLKTKPLDYSQYLMFQFRSEAGCTHILSGLGFRVG
jgi:hypothetical protein